MECVGKLQLSKCTVGYGGSKLFGHPVTVSKLISLRFYTARISNLLNRESIFSDRIMYDIDMSNEQWAMLLLNTNNQNGIPCTIKMREDEKIDKSIGIEIEKENNSQEGKTHKLLADFQNEIDTLFPTAKTIREVSRNILDREGSKTSDRKELLSIIEKIEKEYLENKDRLLEVVDTFLKRLNQQSSSQLVEDIKSNFLGFSSFDNKDKVKELLGLIDNTLLLENKIEKTYEKSLQKGVITITEIKSDCGFIEDQQATNGYEITLYQAIEKDIEGIKTILKEEKLVSIQLSASQFANFLVSFNEGEGVTTTIKYRKTTGEVPFQDLNFDIYEKRLRELNKYTNETLDEYVTTRLEEVKTMLGKSIGVRKQRETEIAVEAFYNYFTSNIPFYFSEMVDAAVKTNLNKRMDFQTNVEKVIKDLGVKSFQKELEENNMTTLQNMLNGVKTTNLLENKGK